MKIKMKRISILILLMFTLTIITPTARATYAEIACIEGTEPGCPPDDGSGGTQGPKQPPPPPKDSWYCRWFKIACPAS